jgi:hypothetical protein
VTKLAAPFTTPVVLFLFRRPAQTQHVFEAIQQARPPRLFLIADGPRTDDERALCEQTRAVVAKVDWPCEVTTNYSDTNLGLRTRLASGISWVFEQVEEAIFLEDDCLPNPTFFRFCAELLERYREEPRVMHISGDCFVDVPDPATSYYFTLYAHVWGWASWRRAWAFYDANLTRWSDLSTRRKILEQCGTRSERQFWKKTLDAVRANEIHTWDYQWTFSLMLHDALAINPCRNLVRNIGFGHEATHTTDIGSAVSALHTHELTFPLRHPSTIEAWRGADQQTAKLFFSEDTAIVKKAKHLLRSLF